MIPEAVRATFTLTVGAMPEAWGDPVLVRQVWANLIANAGGKIKFSDLTSGSSSIVGAADPTAVIDISGMAIGLSLGTISGSGSLFLGGIQLTVGSRNEDSTFSGIIQDGGDSGGTGGSLVKLGTGILTLTGANTYTGGTTISGGLINFSAANNFGTGTVTLDGGGLQWATGTTTDISSRLAPLTSNGGTFDTNGNDVVFATAITGTGGLTKAGAGVLTLSGANTYSGGTTVSGGTLRLAPGASLAAGSALSINGGTFDFNGNSWTVGALSGAGGAILLGSGTLTTNSATSTTFAAAISGTGALVKQGSGTLTLTGTSTYSGGTTISGGLINFASAGNFGTGPITLNGGGLQWAAGTSTDISAQLAPLGAAGGTLDTNGSTVTLASAITGTGGLTKQGAGTLILTGNSSYSGGTTVSGGTLQGTTASLQGTIVNNAAVVFNQTSSGTYAGIMSGTGSMTLQGGGTLTLTGANSFTGPTTVNGSTLVVNGSLAGSVTMNGGTLGGNGTVGTLVANGAVLAPGNSIGTLNVNGGFTHNGGVYAVEVNAAGQNDRINVTGAATLNGAAVQVVAAAGTYATGTTYTILSAAGGVSGTYAGVTSNFAFMTPSLSYTANSVLLTLALQGNTPFSGFGGNTPNQQSVGRVLDQSYANATGDFATVIGALASLGTAQASPALNAISGQPYANFGTVTVGTGALFMNALGQQMSGTRRGVPGTSIALAEACDVATCDASALNAWTTALGGFGSVLGNGNAATMTYNAGGAAAGMDYRLDPRFLVGLGVGYTHGTQWVNSFMGQGWTDSISAAAYASFTQAGFYVDALAGYAYSSNQMQRQIVIAGLQPRTASGSTGVNQFLGQVETGFGIGIYAPARATLTPFGRLQVSSATQNGFAESGASSLDLTVAQQTTNSLRSTLGADLGGAIGIGGDRTLDLVLRLGWMHEYADTSRPLTAAFAGAPTVNFTVYGATPQRDGAVIGLSAGAAIADSTSIYLRYNGEVGGGTDNHAFNVGLRFSW